MGLASWKVGEAEGAGLRRSWEVVVVEEAAFQEEEAEEAAFQEEVGEAVEAEGEHPFQEEEAEEAEEAVAAVAARRERKGTLVGGAEVAEGAAGG